MLLPIYHGTPTFYPVSSDLYSAGQLVTPIKRGQLVGINEDSEAVPYDATEADQYPVGLAGDTVGTLSAGNFTNRVSDMGDQSFASGYVTVYNGGEYYVDINAEGDDTDTPTGDVIEDDEVSVGDKLVPSESNPGMLVVDNTNAVYQSSTAKYQLIARVVDSLSASDGKVPTGIPNENEPSGDSDSPRKFARIRLMQL